MHEKSNRLPPASRTEESLGHSLLPPLHAADSSRIKENQSEPKQNTKQSK